MAITPVNPSSPLGKLKTQSLAATSKKSTAQTQATDKVTNSSREPGYGLRVYSQTTLDQLKSIVNEAAQYLNVDLNTVDVTPEGTANTIANFAISMYGLYKQQNPDLSEEEAPSKYDEMIRGAIDTGFNEALKILGGLGINDEQTMSGIQQTYDLIQQKLDNFFETKRAELAQTENKEAVTNPVI